LIFDFGTHIDIYPGEKKCHCKKMQFENEEKIVGYMYVDVLKYQEDNLKYLNPAYL